MQLPPDLIAATGQNVANGSTDLISFGPGVSARIWAWSVAMENGQTGDIRCILGWQSGALQHRLYGALSDEVRSFYQFIPGGLLWDPGQEIRINQQFSAAVAGGTFVSVLYTLQI